MTLERLHKSVRSEEVLKTKDGYSISTEHLPHMDAVNGALETSEFGERWLTIRDAKGELKHQGIMTILEAAQRCAETDFAQPANGLRDRIVSFPVREDVKDYLTKKVVLTFDSGNHFKLRKGQINNLSSFTYKVDVYESKIANDPRVQLSFIFRDSISLK